MDPLLFAVIATVIDAWTFGVSLSEYKSKQHIMKKEGFSLALKGIMVLIKILRCYLIFRGGDLLWIADILLTGTSLSLLVVAARHHKAPTS